jgi:branched-subunit amino acid aminotransferase/4-amino-4-deoxychorismate lyase
MKKFIFLNEKLIEEAKAKISVNDRAFLFGDGVFETCKIFNGRIYNFQAHKSRMAAGLKALKISTRISNLEEKSQQLIAKNQVKDGVLKIEISRGSGGFGYLPDKKSEPLILIRTFEKRVLPTKISLGISELKKPSAQSLPVSCKTKQALPSILSKIYAAEQKLFDVVVLSSDGFISETSAANIFWVKNDKIFTPDKSCDQVLGTAREKLLEISPLKITQVRQKISAIKSADEIFLTNASNLVMSVDELVYHKNGKKTTKKLSKNIGKKLADLMQKNLEESCGK